MKTKWLIVLLMTGSMASGQSLDSLLTLLEESPALTMLDAQSAAIAQRGDQQAAWPEPMVSTSWFVLPVETRLGPQILRIGASQDIPWKGALDNKRAMVRNLAEAPAIKRELDKASLAYELSAAWYEMTGIRERIRLIKQQKEWLDIQADLMRQRIGEGRAGLSAFYQLQLEAETLQQRISSLEVKLSLPQARINGLLSRDVKTVVSTPDSLGSIAWPSADTPAFGQHPSVSLWENRVLGARIAMEQNRWDKTPWINAGLDYIIVGQRDDADPSGNGRDIIAPRVGIRLPIATGKYAAKQQEEEWNIRSYQAGRQQTMDQLAAQWEMAHTNYMEATSNLVSLDAQLEWAQRTLPLVIQSWSEGRSTLEEVLQVYRKCTAIEDQRVDFKVKQHQVVARALELMTQKKLDHGSEDK